MDEGICVFWDRGYHCFWFQCQDCAWNSHSADYGWSKRAGEVHAEILEPGHHVFQKLNPHEEDENDSTS